mmetsp:Transcript_540/g.1843  ORF Transcript_540/g.1843 Transcript_540/m.1843 type:complete len:353 (+) Transcript_540:40-1098(+)
MKRFPAMTAFTPLLPVVGGRHDRPNGSICRTRWQGVQRRCVVRSCTAGAEEGGEETHALTDLTEADLKEVRDRIEKWKNPPREEYPPWLPQTIEYSVRCAQTATAFAFMDSQIRVIVDLPLGRKRKSGLRWSPLAECLHESSVLVSHYCEAFKGMKMRIVVAHEPVPRKVCWMESVETLSEAQNGPSEDKFDVVIIASAKEGDAEAVKRIVEGCSSDTAVVLFNCFLEKDLQECTPQGFIPVYVCRRYEGGAVLLSGHEREWDCFAELSIFEFEHVSTAPPDWHPDKNNLRAKLMKSGISFDPLSKYYKSDRELQNAGFWPFMVIAFPDVLPYDEDQLPTPTPRKKKRFGFF